MELAELVASALCLVGLREVRLEETQLAERPEERLAVRVAS